LFSTASENLFCSSIDDAVTAAEDLGGELLVRRCRGSSPAAGGGIGRLANEGREEGKEKKWDPQLAAQIEGHQIGRVG